MVVVLLPAVAVPTVVRARAAADGELAPITAVPPDRPELGMTYTGLTPAKKGEPCVGGYEVSDPNTCTHGPDAAPPGLDVNREVPPVAPAAAEPVVPDRDTAAAPTDDGLVRDDGGAAAPDGTPALVAEGPPGDAGFTMAASGVACEGDGVTGKRVQVLYVRGATTASRFGQYLESFRTWSAGVDAIYDASAKETGGSRHVRFVTTPDCQVDVREAEIAADAIGNFSATIKALRALGYNRTDRKYMMFADSRVYCGIGSFAGDDRPGARNDSNGGPSYGRSDSGCWTPSVAAHELGHNLGAVNNSAPNSSKAGHCLDENDVMCYNDSGGLLTRIVCPARGQNQRLDCNHDDYYHTSPAPGSYLATHWNMADSQFLIRDAAGGGAPSPSPAASASAAASPSRQPSPVTSPSLSSRPSTGPSSSPAASPSGSPSSSSAGGSPSAGPGSSSSPRVRPPGSPAPGASPDGPTPGRPLRVSDTTANSTRLSWDPAPGVRAYSVGLDGRSLGTVRSPAVRVTGMRADTEYRFQISTVGPGSTLTPYTALATVRTKPVTPVAGAAGPAVLANAMTGGAAELFGARAADGTPVVLARRAGATSQQWTLTPAGDGYLLTSRATGKCVAPRRAADGTGPAPAGTPLVQYACDAGAAGQVWRLVTTPFGAALGTAGGLVIGVSGQRFAGSRLLTVQRPTGARHQSWTVQPG